MDSVTIQEEQNVLWAFPDLYLDSHMELLLVWCQVVALSKKDLPKGPFTQLPLQHDVVPLNVLHNYKAE